MSEEVKLDSDGVPEEAEGFSEKERAANRPGETGMNNVLEAAIDKATGYADSIKSEVASSGTLKRDWVEEAWKCFIKDAADIDPTDPVKAVEAYFQKNASDELKTRCKAEGKDAKGCWKFIEAVARKALHGSSGHIDPAVVYAIAMHWFEDVPKDWDAAPAKATARKAKPTAEKKAKPKKPAETPSEIRKEKERMAKAKAKAKAKTKKPRAQQGFFFEMLEMHTGQPEKDGLSSPQASAGASGEENAMVPSTLPASTSSTESEVQG